MNDAELLRLVQEMSLNRFGLPYRGEVRLNGRFTRLGGRCTVRKGMACIEISRRHLELHGEPFLRETVLHELCHYHLFARGVRHNHRTPEFRDLLAKVGASMHCAPLDTPPRRYERKYAYHCPTCGRIFRRVKPLAKPSSCGHCDRRFNPKHSLRPVPI